jgi:hypothetical protein
MTGSHDHSWRICQRPDQSHNPAQEGPAKEEVQEEQRTSVMVVTASGDYGRQEIESNEDKEEKYSGYTSTLCRLRGCRVSNPREANADRQNDPL